MSAELVSRIQLGLDEVAKICAELSPLLAVSADANVSILERGAAAALLHSFYTEIEKVLKFIARDWDGYLPDSSNWHRDLLNQLSTPAANRPAVLSSELVNLLKEFLAFRHLFRGASLALMKWEKLAPLLAKVDPAYRQFREELTRFLEFLRPGN